MDGKVNKKFGLEGVKHRVDICISKGCDLFSLRKRFIFVYETVLVLYTNSLLFCIQN